MILWPCASCGSTTLCEHRELELVAWAVAISAAAGEIADPLPPRKPPASETLVRKAARL